MATSAFKSTTTRTPIGASPYADDSGTSASSAKAHRRSRSLSRFSRRVLEPESDAAEPPSKGKFVNTVRGSGFPEISLDDLAIEFFSVKDEREDGRESERGRSERRRSSVISSRVAAPTESSERRGRSVSRQRSAVGDRKNVGRSVSRQRSGVGDGRSAALCGGGSGGRIGSDASSRRRRRSVSVVRCQISDSESDIDHPRNSINHGRAKSTTGGNSQMPSLQKPTDLSHRRLGRSLSQKDLSKNGYSSQSSALTDDEAKEICSGKNMIEKTIRAVYAQKKGEHPTGDDANSGLYEAMRKELRYAVDEIKMELEHARVRTTSTLESESFLQSDNSDDRRAVSKVRKGYTTKLEQSEKRKQDLVADIVLEKQRGMDLPKIVRGSVPGPKSSAIAEKPSRARKSNDRNRLSKRLSEEAEMYFEDFISNVEDTDFSSFDGERSDTSSILGVTKTRDAVFQTVETETFQSPTGSISRPGEMDGVNLPWLQWETSNDGSPLPSEDNRVLPVTPKSRVWDAAQVSAQDLTGHSTGSWSPGLDSASSSTREGSVSILKEVESRQRSEFNMDRYLNLKREEDLLFERWRERNQISSGGLLLCSSTFI